MYRVLGFHQPVVRVFRLARDVDQTGATQVRQVARHERLRQVEELDEVAYTQLAGRQKIENAEPRGIGESAEQRFKVGNVGRCYCWRHYRCSYA